MSNLTPFQKLRQIREQIYISIQDAFAKMPNCEIFITDMGLSLYIRIEERDFKIVSELKNGYQKLVLTVMEGKDTENLNEVFLSEIKELKITNEDRSSENLTELKPVSYIGDSSQPINITHIGNEFKGKLCRFLNQ